MLDNILENVQRYYNMLLLLIQAEKEQLSDLQNEMAEVKYSIVIEGLQKDIDRYTELQTVGWRTKKPIDEMSGSSGFVNYFKNICNILLKKYTCIGL